MRKVRKFPKLKFFCWIYSFEILFNLGQLKITLSIQRPTFYQCTTNMVIVCYFKNYTKLIVITLPCHVFLVSSWTQYSLNSDSFAKWQDSGRTHWRQVSVRSLFVLEHHSCVLICSFVEVTTTVHYVVLKTF